MSKNRPVHEIRMGRVRAAVWQNESEAGVRHNVTFTRLYKDGEQWKDSTSFGRDDLLPLAKLADAAAKEALRIKEILVNEGDLVMPGQVLVLLDTVTLDAELAEARAAVAAAQEKIAATELSG